MNPSHRRQFNLLLVMQKKIIIALLLLSSLTAIACPVRLHNIVCTATDMFKGKSIQLFATKTNCDIYFGQGCYAFSIIDVNNSSVFETFNAVRLRDPAEEAEKGYYVFIGTNDYPDRYQIGIEYSGGIKHVGILKYRNPEFGTLKELNLTCDVRSL